MFAAFDEAAAWHARRSSGREVAFAVLRWLADMANKVQVETLLKGIPECNDWRKQNPSIRPNLSRASLRNCDLSNANLSQADLNRVHLEEAELVRADLREADLTGAQMEGSVLRGAILDSAQMGGADLTLADASHSSLVGVIAVGADFSGADLRGADLKGANLRRARLIHTDLMDASLSGADLEAAVLDRTCFGNIDFRGVEGLTLVRHAAPSMIDIETIYRSKGQIPEEFLRGCGVPENFIAYMRSLTGAALEYFSVFISYSIHDQAFADRLYADLQARGVRCWFAPHDIQGGRKLHEQIDEAIRVYDKLLLILSDASMNSPWVRTEIANARAREEQQKRQMLFPITLVPFERLKGWKLFDADRGIDSAREIREYFIPDFSNWKDHDWYTATFERLVRDLKARPDAPPKTTDA